jgi:hypothetical protein
VRLPTLLSKPVAVATGVALTASAAVAVSVAGAPPASACSTPHDPNRPISADAPFDTPARNGANAHLPVVVAPWGTDFGHLPRWKKYPNGRALLREDRVTVRRQGREFYLSWTNVNPRLRSYWLDTDAKILVRGYNYLRMTGKSPTGNFEALRPVSRRQFLYSFNTRGSQSARYVKYRSVYKLTFDRSLTHVRKIEELPVLFYC